MEQKFFDDYAKWTDTVAKYPPTAEPFYLALGIADEVGELVGATSVEASQKEAGDVLWYCARYATRVLNVPFSEVLQEAADLGYVSVQRAMINVGLICGVEKKRIRDGELWDAQKKIEKEGSAMRSLIIVLAWVIYAIGPHNLVRVLEMNMGKLQQRAEAGTLRGDGDNR